MTAQELIEELKKVPPNTIVTIQVDHEDDPPDHFHITSFEDRLNELSGDRLELIAYAEFLPDEDQNEDD